MKLIPAIDILDGRAVRLLRGDYAAVTDYGDPLEQAARWRSQGAELLHVVDLEAARGGDRQVDVLSAMHREGIPFQLGGGIRTRSDALDAAASGALRLVVGSAVTSGGRDAEGIVDAVGSDRVVAALDVRGGRARGSGWTDEGMELAEAVARVGSLGIRTVLATGIEKDGALAGPDLALLDDVFELDPSLALIASGGVSSLDDLRTLSASRGVSGVVVGRAIYEGCFDVATALAVDGIVP